MLNLLEQKPPLPLRLVSLFFALCSLLYALFAICLHPCFLRFVPYILSCALLFVLYFSLQPNAFSLFVYALRCSVLIELNERNNSMNAITL